MFITSIKRQDSRSSVLQRKGENVLFLRFLFINLISTSDGYIKCSISCAIRSCLSTEHLTEMDDPLSLKLSKYINFPWKNIQPAKNVQHAMIAEKFISETLYLNAAKLSIRNTPKFTNIHFEIKIGSPTAQQVSYE